MTKFFRKEIEMQNVLCAITSSLKLPKSISKRLKKILKIAISLQMDCSGIGSLTKIKDVADEIVKKTDQALKAKEKND